MARKKRKFIDKKNAVTFRLVHRSQKDPLTTDENAPKRVLQPVEGRTDDLEKYGIFYDDDYDYMQHLKETTSGSDLVRVEGVKQPRVELSKVVSKGDKAVLLPSSVFPSEVESKVGLLNMAAPRSGLQLDLDPDIVAAMDEDFDFDDPDNLLDDDFVLQANGGAVALADDVEFDDDFDDEDIDGSGDSNDEFESDGSMDSNERMDRLMDLEETKSRFTEYSMTSSVMRRNEQLTILDNKFEKMFEQYDDDDVGALDCEEIEGDLDTESDLLKQVAEEFQKTQITGKLELEKPVVRYYSDSESDDSECSVIEVKPKEQWDCESILSTNSNIYNHPKLISAPGKGKIKLDSRGIPVDEHKLTKNTLSKLEGADQQRTGPASIASMASTFSNRPKDETPEERAARKKAYREFKKERRLERKCNKEAFKEEKKRMERVMQNTNKMKHHIPV